MVGAGPTLQQRIKVPQPTCATCRKRVRYVSEDALWGPEGGRILTLQTLSARKSHRQGSARSLQHALSRPWEPRWGEVSHIATKVHLPAGMFEQPLAHQPPAPYTRIDPIVLFGPKAHPHASSPSGVGGFKRAAPPCADPGRDSCMLNIFIFIL